MKRLEIFIAFLLIITKAYLHLILTGESESHSKDS